MFFSKKDYLKYSWLNLSWDFVIEMNIYIPSTNPWDTRFLFQLWDYKLYLLDNWKIKLSNGIWNKFYELFNYSLYSWFQKFITIKQWNTYIFKIWNTELWRFTNSNPINSSASLYIWSDSNKYNQINSIVDYVKIYK